MPLKIIAATNEHAAEMVALTIASITQLCFEDHGNDPEYLAEWLANKTTEQMTVWINDPNQYVIVAFVNNVMVGAGGCNEQGHIMRNYVHPEHRFKGISKALMANMEDYLHLAGIKQASLESSETALRFYLDLGWRVIVNEDRTGDEIDMVKAL